MIDEKKARARVAARLRPSAMAALACGEAEWEPYDIVFGAMEADSSLAEVQNAHASWSAFCTDHGLGPYKRGKRTLDGIGRVVVPRRVTVETLEQALSVAGKREDYDRAVRRVAAVEEAVGRPVTAAEVAPALDYRPLDFEYLLRALRVLEEGCLEGSSYLELAIPGVHAKWADAEKMALAETLLGFSLGTPADTPRTVAYRPLDGSPKGVWTVGDPAPDVQGRKVFLVMENKRPFDSFPDTPGAVAVYGAGWAGAPDVCAFLEAAGCERAVYWGDMDAYGLYILSKYREHRPGIESAYMDPASYAAWRRLGAETDRRGKPLRPAPLSMPDGLTEVERELFETVQAPDCRIRRIEQERVPEEAVRRLSEALAVENRNA